jgi:hypothetical protein
MVIAICAIISFIFLSCFHYLKEVSDLDFKKWDVNNVTASDFTVMMEITDKMWKNYQ